MRFNYISNKSPEELIQNAVDSYNKEMYVNKINSTVKDDKVNIYIDRGVSGYTSIFRNQFSGKLTKDHNRITLEGKFTLTLQAKILLSFLFLVALLTIVFYVISNAPLTNYLFPLITIFIETLFIVFISKVDRNDILKFLNGINVTDDL